MSFPPQFQIVSDLHLETPVTTPLYDVFKLPIYANNLLLLGDIGLAKDDGLFKFLRRLLEQTPNLRIFYVLGNHEAYQLSHDQAIERMRAFEASVKFEYGNRFIFLHRNRYDINEFISILGCTLWTNITSHQAADVQTRLTDFNEQRGIREWSIDLHMDEHQKDLEWLNSQVRELQEKEPQRQVIIATHHSPSCDPAATNPNHRDSPISSGFVTDLSQEPCWLSPAVKLWAFGHTHYSCAFQDEKTGKLVVANQKGYSGVGASSTSRMRGMVVESDSDDWKIIAVDGEEAKQAPSHPTSKINDGDSQLRSGGKQHKPSHLHRGTQHFLAIFRSRTRPSK